MSTFDKIIGYDHIKAELMQISDMIHHPEVYAALDAKLRFRSSPICMRNTV